MKHIIALTFAGLLALNYLSGQEFKYKGLNLFGLEYVAGDSTKGAIRTLFYDMDADGDQDAILVGIDSVDKVDNVAFNNIHYFMEIQENTGDRWHPSFKTRKPFMDNFPFPNGYFYPSIGDLNNDKMPDFIVSSGVDSFLNLQTLLYQRKSMSGGNQFKIIGTDSLELNPFISGSFFVPELVDMDMDGDLDLLMSGFLSVLNDVGEEIQKPMFLYAKNIGTINKPKFRGWYPNPYGLAGAIIDLQLSTVGDIDNDNDNDILSLATVDTFKVFTFLQNNHTPDGKPNFNSFSTLLDLPQAGNSESLYPPSLVDIDGDGDMDIFLVQDLKATGAGIGYYENMACSEVLDNTITRVGNTLQASIPNVKYQWYDCTTATDISGATAQIFAPDKSGKYAVKLDNNKGCENRSICYEFVISATKELDIASQVTIYPNPTDDYFSISNYTGYTISIIKIVSSAGQVLKTMPGNQIEKISTKGLISGNYLVEINCNGKKIIKQLSVQR